jgi:hypothetical protein
MPIPPGMIESMNSIVPQRHATSFVAVLAPDLSNIGEADS